MFGYEFPESLIVIVKDNIYFMATSKKCSFIEKDLVGKSSEFKVHILKREKGDNVNAANFDILLKVIQKG